MTRKRSAETGAERLEEKTAETAKADADKRVALKRKSENDSSDLEVEESRVEFTCEIVHREDDPESEVDLLLFQQRDRYVASVHETGGDKPVCKTHTICAVGDYIENTSGNNTCREGKS